MANAFDDITPDPSQVQTSAPASANAFDDITPPVVIPKAKPPVTAADRVEAGEAGFLKGAAYLAATPADVPANVVNLARTGAGGVQALYNNLTTGGSEDFKIPGSNLYHWVDPKTGLTTYGAHPPPPGATKVQIAPDAPTISNGQAFPAGGALTHLMDQNDVTSTQINRPDDPMSRYISAGASAVPGILTGSLSPGTVARTTAATVPGAVGAQMLADKGYGPASGIAAQVANALLVGRGKGAPLDPVQAAALKAAQDKGLVFPPATTNPTGGNKALEATAGKTSVTQNASATNQPIVNDMVREQIGLPPGNRLNPDGSDFKTAEAIAAPGYDALRGYGQIQAPANFGSKLNQAIKQNVGASRMSAALGDPTLNRIVNELGSKTSFDSSDAMDAIAELRDRANNAFTQQNTNLGKAYRGVSGVIEDAIGDHLQNSVNPNDWDLLQNYQNSRQQFAQIATARDAMNPNSGNIVAKKLGAALAGKPYAQGTNMGIIAQAEAQAPRAFAEPTNSPGVNHLGVWGSLIGGMEAARIAHENLGAGGNAAAIGIGTAAAIPAARVLARSYLLGNPNGALPTGQSHVIPLGRGALLPGTIAGAYGATGAGSGTAP